MFEHIHELLGDFATVITAVGILVAAVSSLLNGSALRRHAQTTTAMHEQNNDKLELLIDRSLRHRSSDTQ